MPARQFAFPPLTQAVKMLIFINVGVFLVNALLAGALIDWFGVWLGGILEYFGLGSVRLVTYQFLHSYLSIRHILFNMLFLYFFGGMVESEVGKRGLIKLYLVSGVVGALVQILLSVVFGTTDIRTVGASGAVYGIMVYAAFMAPSSKVWFFGIIPVMLGWLVGILVFIGVYETILMVQGHLPPGGVAHGAHLGGALWGFLAFRFFRSSYMTADHRPFFGGIGGRFQRWRADREAKASQERQATLDQLLEKVHREGMSSLTAAERRFLERTSKGMKR